MYHQPDCESFDAFGRVLSGTLKVGQEIKVSSRRQLNRLTLTPTPNPNP